MSAVATIEDDSKDLDDNFQDSPDKTHCSCPATTACILFCPCICLCSFYTVNVREEVVILSCGKYTDKVTDPGCHFKNCCGREMRRISKQKTSVNLPNVKILDKNGNPLHVSGVVVYNIENTKRAAIDIRNLNQFVENQALATMKQVVSRYPYEHWDGDKETDECLNTGTDKIGNELVRQLQRQVAIAGVKVHSFKLNEISYAPEIAQGMLKRQQAEAVVAARKTIVEGAVEISFGAVSELETRGVKLQPEEKAKMVSTLLTVICAENHVQPTINLNGV